MSSACGCPSVFFAASAAAGGAGGGAEGMSSLVKTFLGLGAVFGSARAWRAASATGSLVVGGACCAGAVNAATPRIADRAEIRNRADECMVTFLHWSGQGAPKRFELYSKHYCNALRAIADPRDAKG